MSMACVSTPNTSFAISSSSSGGASTSSAMTESFTSSSSSSICVSSMILGVGVPSSVSVICLFAYFLVLPFRFPLRFTYFTSGRSFLSPTISPRSTKPYIYQHSDNTPNTPHPPYPTKPTISLYPKPPDNPHPNLRLVHVPRKTGFGTLLLPSSIQSPRTKSPSHFFLANKHREQQFRPTSLTHCFRAWKQRIHGVIWRTPLVCRE